MLRGAVSGLSVLMVIQRFRPYFSGQGVQLEDLCRVLARRGVESTILTAAHATEAGLEPCAGYVIERLRCDPPFAAGRGPGRLWSPVFALRTLVRLARLRRRIDVIHVHALTDALYAARIFGWLAGVPVVFEMTLKGEDDPASVLTSRNLMRGVRWALYRRADAYVAISAALARIYEEEGLPRDRLSVIPQGVDLLRYSPVADRPRLRRELGLPETGPLLVFVGSLIARKGIDVLLEAWARIHAVRPDAHLALVGIDRFPQDPQAESFLAERLARLSSPAAGRVLRLGFRDSAPFLQASDAFLFPSRREGFGSVIVEAMACGLPCVVAELSGITDFVFAAPLRGDGATGDGVVVPQDDPAGLAAAAVTLLEDPARAAEIGRRARRRAEDAFGFERIADRYLELYAGLLERNRRSIAAAVS